VFAYHLPTIFHLRMTLVILHHIEYSDVTIIKINIEIASFRKIERNRYHDFGSKCDSILILYCPRGTGNRHRRS